MSSQTEVIYQAIYENILDGTLSAGEKLHIGKLAKRFAVGLSPVREALSKLTGTNLVIAISQRGFKVLPLSLEDMDDLYTTRIQIEKIALTLSIEKGDANWEANLLAAFHLLSQAEKKETLNTIEDYKFWEKHHRVFNLALIAACGLKHLLIIQEKLYQQTERYRRIWFLAGLKKNSILTFSTKQKLIMEAALARDVEKAASLLEDHFENAKTLISDYLRNLSLP